MSLATPAKDFSDSSVVNLTGKRSRESPRSDPSPAALAASAAPKKPFSQSSQQAFMLSTCCATGAGVPVDANCKRTLGTPTPPDRQDIRLLVEDAMSDGSLGDVARALESVSLSQPGYAANRTWLRANVVAWPHVAAVAGSRPRCTICMRVLRAQCCTQGRNAVFLLTR